MSAPSLVGSAQGIVELDMDRGLAQENDSLGAALADHYGGEVAGSALTPPSAPDDLRSELRAAAPRLAALTDEIRALFDSGVCAVLGPKVGLTGLEVDQRRKMIFAVAALLGNVTEVEPVGHRVVWDVRTPRQEEQRNLKKNSESDGEAEYHTDSSFKRVPERFFLLYSVRQAHCGGGVSLLRDGRALRRRLEETPDGRSAIQVLTETRLPTRIPKWYRGMHGATADDGYSYEPILSDQPLWRWRRDKIEQGLTRHPECATPEVRAAVDTVAGLLADPADEFRQVLPTDSIVIVNNHVGFHGRTAFTDPDRHLLRIRFHDPAAAAA